MLRDDLINYTCDSVLQRFFKLVHMLRELHTLKGHVESVKLKTLIQSNSIIKFKEFGQPSSRTHFGACPRTRTTNIMKTEVNPSLD